MVLEGKRAAADRFLLPAARAADRAGLTPDGLTVLSLALAFAAAALLWQGQQGAPLLLALGGLLVLGSAALDALDGRLARFQGSATKRGDYLDHVTDRYADVAILLGLGLAPGNDLRVLLLAVVGTLLTSYMGTQAQAVGVGRNYKGLMSRADRLLLLGCVPIAQALLPGARLLGVTLLAATLVLIGVLGNLTALQRFAAAWRELGAADRASAPAPAADRASKPSFPDETEPGAREAKGP